MTRTKEAADELAKSTSLDDSMEVIKVSSIEGIKMNPIES